MEHKCIICDKVFKSSSSLYRHLRCVHKCEDAKFRKGHEYVCSVCKHITSSKKQFYIHVTQMHDVKIETETLQFSCEEDFFKWKTEIEKDSNCKFVRENDAVFSEASSSTVTHLHCHRSGFFNSKGNNQRLTKVLGSNKINGFCPGEITLSKKISNLSVTYVKTHLGHSSDLGRMQLTTKEKTEIACKLVQKIPITEILDSIRESVGDELQRIHLLSRKDINNIKLQYNIGSDGSYDSNDATSVNVWVQKMLELEDSPIKYYKPQGEEDKTNGLEKNDFLLVIMKEAQKELLTMYGNDVICVDFTHGMNAYGFDLATILVLDDKHEGFPSALIFSNRQDKTALVAAFKSIKDAGVELNPSVFMTDDAEAFYNAWVEVFGRPQKRLLCTWHVEKNWRKKLQELVKNPEDIMNTYKILNCLLLETDETTFLLMLDSALILMLEKETTKKFGEYFSTYYSTRPELWAFCYRKWATINTNNFIERMHKTIKYIYFNGKKVKRLDKAIYTLMKFVRDRQFDRLIALEKGKISSKINCIRNRHRRSLNMDVANIQKMEDSLDSIKWLVQSESLAGEFYTVQKTQRNCSDCPLICNECNCCLHSYICTCIDNCIQWNMCKHIHLVNSVIRKSNIDITPDTVEAVEDLILIAEDNKQKEVSIHLQELKGNKSNCSDNYKEKINELIEQIKGKVEECSGPDDYNKIISVLTTTKLTIEAHLQSKEDCLQFLPKVGAVSEPVNKKIVKQDFFKVRKDKKRKSFMSHASRSELNSTALELVQFSKKKKE